MAFQDNCGTIVIDAVLTDIGRQKLGRGTFRVSKFALGDDEVDYALSDGNFGHSYNLDNTETPILEAFGTQTGAIKYGLLSLPREDLLYFPTFFINEKVPSAAKRVGEFYYLSVNSETTSKLESDIGSIDYVLETNKSDRNFILLESGIGDLTTSISQGPVGKERFITNLGLMDEYLFAYCDGRFIDQMLSNKENSYFRNDTANNLYLDVVLMKEVIKISMDSTFDNYETYYIPTINNEIFDDNSQELSAVDGPRGMASAFNFKVSDKMISDSTSPPDERYQKFGTLGATLFVGGNKYDYVDTSILVEGTSTGIQMNIPIRIIRYAGN